MTHMVKKIFSVLLMVFFSIGALQADSLAAHNIADNKISDADKVIITEMAQGLFPGIAIENILPTPIPSLFAVTQGTQIVYLDPSHQLIFMGTMIDAKTQVNLTEQSRRSIVRAVVNGFDFSSAIKEVHGNGQRVLIIFEDPYCKYCRQLLEQLNKLTNVTLYTYIVPILRESSFRIAHQIMCDPHPDKVWRLWMKTYELPSTDISSCMVDGLKKNIGYAQKLGVVSVPVIVFPSGEQIAGLLSSDDIEKMLDKG